MSALAGVFKFDPRNYVTDAELSSLAHGIDRIGPDGGGEYLNFNLGMAYRAFHTTPESHFENQPVVGYECILTWDGRLDNREEISARLTQKYLATPTDLDLVFAAYQEWGTACLAELCGDWALALWDRRKQQLILARDYIGVRRLFYRLDSDGMAWCTAPEPLVLTSPKVLHLDPLYLAGCFYPRPPLETSPYQEIRGILPAHFLTVHTGGRRTSDRYWSLNPSGRIRYPSDQEYEEQFQEIFAQAIRQRLRADRTITAELSGGVDSSSIVCMADYIRNSESGPSIETLSYYDDEEPSGDERPYFSLIEKQRGRVGSHISMSQFTQKTRGQALSPLPGYCFAVTPGYFSRSLQWDRLIQNRLKESDSRVILSGLGGDEILGGVQYEAPELAEYFIAGRMIAFCHSLLAWSLARKKTISGLLCDVFQLLKARFDPASMQDGSISSPKWVYLKPHRDHTSLRSFSNWSRLSPARIGLEWARYSLASQLSSTDLPLIGCAENRYPYLDRRLFTFLAAIPRGQVLQPHRRRHLMRRALRHIVPEEVLFRKTKWFGSRSILSRLRDDREIVNRMFDDPWLSDGHLIDAGQLRVLLSEIEHGGNCEVLQLLSAIGIEQWLRSQLNHWRVKFSPYGKDRGTDKDALDCLFEALTSSQRK
jgi:asparagine synthase (glutamine-hydrolysing)